MAVLLFELIVGREEAQKSDWCFGEFLVVIEDVFFNEESRRAEID